MKAQDPKKVKQFLDLAAELELTVFIYSSKGSGYYHVEKHCQCYKFVTDDSRFFETFYIDDCEVEKGLLLVDEVHFEYKG